MTGSISGFNPVFTPDVVSSPEPPRASSAPLNPLVAFDLPGFIPDSVPEPQSDLPPAVRERAISSALERAEHPPLAQVPSQAAEARTKLAQASERLKEARDEGVDLAKTSFWKKMINVATAAVTVGVAAALTAVSFGLATPLLAIACVNMAVTIGDAVCAHHNVKNAQALADGRDPPYALPEGNSCVKNLLHATAKAFGAGDDTAKSVAKYGGGAFQLGLAVTAFALGAATAALPAAHQAASLVASSINGLMAAGTVLRTGVIESTVGGPGYTQSLLNDAVQRGREAREIDPGVEGQTPEEKRLLELLDDPEIQSKTQRLVTDSVTQYGDPKVNLAIAVAGIVGVGKAILTS